MASIITENIKKYKRNITVDLFIKIHTNISAAIPKVAMFRTRRLVLFFVISFASLRIRL